MTDISGGGTLTATANPIHPVLGECNIWTGAKGGHGYGAVRHQGKTVYVHRLAAAAGMGMFWPDYQHMQIDHRCHRQLCVNPQHLRPTTNKQNGENRLGAQKNSKSGIRGVFWEESRRGHRGHWRAAVGHRGKIVHVGTFATVEAAAAAVIAKRLELFTHNDEDRVA
jgi:hypothetical protein